MRNHRAFGFGIQHAIEDKVIGINCFASDFLNSIGTQCAYDQLFCDHELNQGYAAVLDRFTCPQGFSRGENGILNRGIARATAKRILQRKTNIITVRIRVALEQRIRRHDLPRDAESALDCAMFNEGFLQRMQVSSLQCTRLRRKSFDGDDGLAIRALGGIDARHHGSPSTRTVHAPHSASSQPIFVPVRRSRWRRRVERVSPAMGSRYVCCR